MHLILDFDGTITLHDTIHHLATAAVAAQRARSGGSSDLQPAWDALVEAYAADVRAYRAKFAPTTTTTTTTSNDRDKDDDDALAQHRAFLAGLRDVELASLDRAAAAGIFRGLDGDAMRRMGRASRSRVGMRAGLDELLRVTADEGAWPVSVVSANWSAEFVRGVIGDDDDGVGDVVANEVVGADGTVCGPSLGGGGVLVCAPDKLRAMRGVVGREGGGEGAVVYVGDSETDMECVLAAGHGVVVGDGGLLATLRGLGFEVPRLRGWGGGGGGRLPKLSWIHDFHELAACLDGYTV